jgi:hypothetical protein
MSYQPLINSIRPSKIVNAKFQSHYKGLPAFNVSSVNSLSSIKAQQNKPVLKRLDPQKITITIKWFKVKLTLEICWIKIWNILYSKAKKNVSNRHYFSIKVLCKQKYMK